MATSFPHLFLIVEALALALLPAPLTLQADTVSAKLTPGFLLQLSVCTGSGISPVPSPVPECPLSSPRLQEETQDPQNL